MVWFQCDDCGDNVKKPKLANHFRACRAASLSCIDCGSVFNRQSVQQHTQCVSEAEKYGPKGGAAKPPNGGAAASRPNEAPVEEVTMGLSTRPPWSCSLCNVKATGRETLHVHGQSKRHRAKARAAIAAGKSETQGKASDVVDAEQGNEKKRKREAAADGIDQDQAKLKVEADIDGKLEGEQKIVDEPAGGLIISKDIGSANGKQKPDADLLKVVKWRKLISGLLKKTPDGTLRKKKLEKAIMPMAIEAVTNAGVVADASVLKSELRTYLDSSSRFVVDGKLIQLKLKE